MLNTRNLIFPEVPKFHVNLNTLPSKYVVTDCTDGADGTDGTDRTDFLS